MKLTPLQFILGLIIGVCFLTNFLLRANVSPEQREFGRRLDRMNQRTSDSACESLRRLEIESERCKY